MTKESRSRSPTATKECGRYRADGLDYEAWKSV